jgi:hypothetical protein
MVKNLLLVLFMFFAISSVYSQEKYYNKWTDIEYHYSSGPVSPPYQYKYIIKISESGAGTISYTKGTNATKEASFTVSKKNLKKLTSAVKKTRVMEVDPNEMKAEQKIGGAVHYTIVTVINTNPNLDQGPRHLQFPYAVNETYLKNITALYTLIESLVPQSTLDTINN